MKVAVTQMRFTPHDRVIELLVGQDFYTTSDHAIRELLQNAEDACELQRIRDGSFGPRIVVRFSKADNWVEISDNGLGMNLEAFEKSFASVAAPKDEVSHIRELIQTGHSKQISYFGIGILSCFGVADSIDVISKMDNDEPVAFRISGIKENFEILDEKPAERGTVIRLRLKKEGSMVAGQAEASVRRYARHAPHVFVEDADNGTQLTLTEEWLGSDLPGVARITDDPAIRDGVIVLDSSWEDNSVPQSFLKICNGGFLVSEQDSQLLPSHAIGYCGEIDLIPGQLSILINREGFQRDESWQQLGQRLLNLYNELIKAKAVEWAASLDAGEKLKDGAVRGILLLLHGPTHSVLQQPLLDELTKLLPRMLRVKVASREQAMSAASLLKQAKKIGVVYYLREDQGPRKFQQTLGQASTQVQITEVLETVGLRTSHLLAKGHLVVNCARRQYSVNIAGSTQKIVVHDADLLSSLCQKEGVRWVAVDEATSEEVHLEASRHSELVTRLLGAGSEIKLTSVDSPNRVIRDVNGRLLNCSHPDVRKLLAVFPDAVGNSVKRALLQVYMDLDTWNIEAAREKIFQLLLEPNLTEDAQMSTPSNLRNFLQQQVDELLREGEVE